MSQIPKDLFIIHSKHEQLEGTLASRLIDWLTRVGISVYEYSDWQWAKNEPGKVRYSSAGNDLDPIRYATGHPEPFRRKTWEEVPDRDTLDEMLGNCRVVTFIAPRGGSLSPGVDVERKVLPWEPAVVLATWGDQNDWLVQENRHGYLYQITSIVDPKQEKAALDLAHIVWLHWVFDSLAHEGKGAGRKLLLELVRQNPIIRRILQFSGRMSRALGKRLSAERADTPSTLEPTLVSLADSMSADEVRPVVRHWWGQSSFQAALPPPPSREVASLVRLASKAFENFCDAALRRYPELADEKAEANRLRAAHANALGEVSLAMQHLNDALELSGLSTAARSCVLADRAAMTLRSAPVAAQTDIEAILALSGASGMATAQALWLRARLRVRRGDAVAALSDLSAALTVAEIAPVVRALCLHERANLRTRAGDRAQAVQDLDEALRIRGLPAVIVGPAHLDRAVLRGELGDVEGELADYSKTIELEGAPDETRLKAFMYRGLSRMERGDRLGAITDFVVVRDDEAAPPEAKRAAVQNLEKLDPLK